MNYNFGMKKSKLVIFLAFALVMALFTGCTTSVSMNNLVPARVNIGGDRVIALTSTQPFAYGAESKVVGQYATSMLQKALSNGVYKVIEAKTCDAVVNGAKNLFYNPTEELKRFGANILVQSYVDAMNWYDTYEEKTVKDSKGIIKHVIYSTRHAELTLRLVVWDLETQQMLDTVTYSGKKTSDSQGAYSYDSRGNRIYKPNKEQQSPKSLFDEILQSFSSKITKRLVPHYETSSISLMEDKSKERRRLDEAFYSVRNNDLRTALRLFEADWDTTHQTVSGYNAAVLYYAIGDYNKAINLAYQVYNTTGNSKSLSLASRLENMYDLRNTAIDQIEGNLPVTPGAIIPW